MRNTSPRSTAPKNGMERTNDVLAFLGAVVRQNTAHYQSDFEYDKKMLREAAGKPNAADRTFYWMSRDCGTWCFKERDVFMRDSDQNITWQYHEGESGILAFRVLITGLDGGKLTGEIQPFNYAEQVQRVKRSALPIKQVTGVYEDGTPFIAPYKKYDTAEMTEHGGIKELRYEPENELELSNTLAWEHRLQENPPKRPRQRRAAARRH